MNKLPPEIICMISSYLNKKDLLSFLLINKTFSNILKANILKYKEYENKGLSLLTKEGNLEGVKYLIERKGYIPNKIHLTFICACFNHYYIYDYLIQ